MQSAAGWRELGLDSSKGVINRQISQPQGATRNVPSPGEIPAMLPSRAHEGSPGWPKLWDKVVGWQTVWTQWEGCA